MSNKVFPIGWNLELYDFTDKERCVSNLVLYMLNRTQKIFKYKNLPDSIPKRDLEILEQCNGSATIAEVDGKLYAFRGGLGGAPNVYYRPTISVVANPALNLSKTFTIDSDCIVIPNDSMYLGLLPLHRRYATAIMENEISMRCANINLRIQDVFSADNDRTLNSAKIYMDGVEKGKLGVIAEQAFLNGIKVNNGNTASTSHSLTGLIEYQQYVKASWFNELGLNANYNMKREAITANESQMNSDSLLPLIDDMLENRQEGWRKVNEMFGTNVEVELDSAWEDNLIELEAAQKAMEISNRLEETQVNSSNGEEKEESEGDKNDEKTE